MKKYVKKFLLIASKCNYKWIREKNGFYVLTATLISALTSCSATTFDIFATSSHRMPATSSHPPHDNLFLCKWAKP
jgi:hypothetical protein